MTPRKFDANFAETDVDDETLLIDMDGGLLFSLTGTGQAVWKAIDGTADRDALVRLMMQRYRGEAAAIGADVDRLLHDFAAARLITLGP